METNEFLYKVVIIFIPGIMGRFFLMYLSGIKINTLDKYYFALSAFLIGVPSYFIYDICSFAFLTDTSWFPVTAEVLGLVDTTTINVQTIATVTFISLSLSGIWAFIEKKHWLPQKTGANIWNDLFNSQPIQENPWVVVRDRKYDLSYQGILRIFSDTPAVPELYLTDVTVYNASSGVELYKVDALYLYLEQGRVEIECLPKPASSPSDNR